MQVKLTSITSDYAGYKQLIELNARAEELLFDELLLDMTQAYWLDANMSAPLGALLYRLGRRGNMIRLVNLNPPVKQILQKNGFLSNYGQEKIQDTNKTTIEYKRFEVKDERYFTSYIEEYFLGKGLPQMSAGVHKKLRESIFEIFSNSVLHSETSLGIFTCGQFFPTKNSLHFSLVDLGIGIRQKIKNALNRDFSAEQAITWATEDSNTTKTGAIPGGLGLKLLREFIDMNRGSIQIISDCGYWQLAGGIVSTQRFGQAFPGTVVNIQINTADTHAYRLSSEVNANSIF